MSSPLQPDPAIREAVAELAVKDPRYPPQAHYWLLRSLDRLLETIAREEKDIRHVSGEELSMFLVSRAVEEFGPMAADVMAVWGIHGTIDFGEMVYALIGAGVLSKTPKDRLADFEDVCNLQEALTAPFASSGTPIPRDIRREPIPAEDD